MTEAATVADFSKIRYAQVWEDADILIDGLNIQPGAVCLSIASAGDNALALLTRNPEQVFAIDLNPAQLHCLALRVAAFRTLDHAELLELIGSRASARRLELYQRCRDVLDTDARQFWDGRHADIAAGIGNAGKFEHYFSLFRRRIIPLIHPRKRIMSLFARRTRQEREAFYTQTWDTWRWRVLFRVFFSRFIMGRLGRDPAFFTYVEGSVAERILTRTRYALTELDPCANPYLQWILLGHHGGALPCYLREEHFTTIRANLDRLKWRLMTIEDFTAEMPSQSIDAFNLSDIFEYMSPQNTGAILRTLHRVSRPGARLAYWNMLAPRSRPETLAAELVPLEAESRKGFERDKAFFYSRFVIEEVRG